MLDAEELAFMQVAEASGAGRISAFGNHVALRFPEKKFRTIVHLYIRRA
jgi:hypothetical protein